MKSFCTFILSLFVSATAVSQVPQGLILDQFSSTGSGCPQDTAFFTVSPDNSAVSFLFNQYSLELNSIGRQLKNCTINFRITPPRGYQLMVTRIDYRGFKALPQNSSAIFWSRIRQNVGRGMNRHIGETSQTFTGPTNEDYYITAESTHRGNLTNCVGTPLMFQFDSSLSLNNNSQEPAILSLDSVDIDLSAATTLRLVWQKCR